jgi:hypothetical protein
MYVWVVYVLGPITNYLIWIVEILLMIMETVVIFVFRDTFYSSDPAIRVQVLYADGQSFLFLTLF